MSNPSLIKGWADNGSGQPGAGAEYDQEGERGRALTLLREQFYNSYDEGLAFSLLKDLRQRGQKAEMIGEGAHFQAFLFRAHSSFPLVISIAKPNFCRGLSSERGRWCRAMATIQHDVFALIPPTEILHFGEELAYITPYAPNPASRCNALWRPLETWEVRLANLLADRRLMLDDVLQIRSLQGLPFVVDWSDLKDLKRP